MICSDRALSKRLELTEARANVEFIESRAKLCPGSGATWIQVCRAYAMFDGPDSPCTQTFGLGICDTPSAADLSIIEAFFKRRNAPVFHEVSPLADISLINFLYERSYKPIEYSSVLFLELAQRSRKNSLNPAIKIRVIDPHEIPLWAETSAKGWASEIPDFFDIMLEFGKIYANCSNCHAFIAEIRDTTIATGTLFIIDGVALIAGDSTILEERGQGAQTALLDARLNFAFERGCTIAMMAASPGSNSQKNGEKNGFRIAYTRTKWQMQLA